MAACFFNRQRLRDDVHPSAELAEAMATTLNNYIYNNRYSGDLRGILVREDGKQQKLRDEVKKPAEKERRDRQAEKERQIEKVRQGERERKVAKERQVEKDRQVETERKVVKERRIWRMWIWPGERGI